MPRSAVLISQSINAEISFFKGKRQSLGTLNAHFNSDLPIEIISVVSATNAAHPKSKPVFLDTTPITITSGTL